MRIEAASPWWQPQRKEQRNGDVESLDPHKICSWHVPAKPAKPRVPGTSGFQQPFEEISKMSERPLFIIPASGMSSFSIEGVQHPHCLPWDCIWHDCSQLTQQAALHRDTSIQLRQGLAHGAPNGSRVRAVTRHVVGTTCFLLDSSCPWLRHERGLQFFCLAFCGTLSPESPAHWNETVHMRPRD